jgi:DNA-binding LytR/AlgR family response regulator
MDSKPPKTSAPTALIADDDAQAREDLTALLRIHWPDLRVIAEADNGADAWDLFLEREPSVCFLDMRMPRLTGIEVAQRTRGRTRLVLMAKASDPALGALARLGARHLLKPFDMQLATTLIEQLRSADELPTPIRSTTTDLAASPVRRSARIDTIPGALDGERRELPVEGVVYLEADGRFTRVVLEHGDFQARFALKELVPQLDPREFWQIHRYIVVNRRHIESAIAVEGGGVVVTLRGRNERLPVGSHFLERFKSVVGW